MRIQRKQPAQWLLIVGMTLYTACGGGGGPALPRSGVSGAITNGGIVVAMAPANLGEQIKGVFSLNRMALAVGPGISGATVRVVDSVTDAVLATAATTATGSFQLPSVPVGDNRILRVEVQTAEDLNGDGSNDRVKVNIPIRVLDTGDTTANVEIKSVDDNGDASKDSVEVDKSVQVPGQPLDDNVSRQNRRQGFTRTDTNDNGVIDDSDMWYADHDGDGLANDDPEEHDIDDDGLSNSVDSDDDNDSINDDADDDDDGDGLDDSAELEFKGFITAIGAGTITVGTTTVNVTTSTLILDFVHLPITVADLSVGDLVEVKAIQGLTLDAVRINMEDDASDSGDRQDPPDMDSGEVELTGAITALTAGTLTVGGTEFTITGTTTFFGLNNQPIAFSALAVGDLVEAKGQIAGSVVNAVQVKMEDDALGTNEVELTGLITALTLNSLTVGGQVFLVNAATEVLGLQDQPIAFSSLAVGDLVEAKGTVSGPTTTATRVKLEDDASEPDEVEVTGLITALTATSLTVNGQAYVVNEFTVTLDDNNVPIPFTNLEVGNNVEVKAVSISGVWTATRIKIET